VSRMTSHTSTSFCIHSFCLFVFGTDEFSLYTCQPKFQIKYNLKVIGGSTGVIPGLGDMIEASVLSFHPLFMFSSNLQNIATILLDICNFVNQEIISYKSSMYIGKHKSIGTFLVSNIRSHGS
jgi:hypothetical protein